MEWPAIVPMLAVAAATLVAATTDLWKFKVYNALTFPTLAAGLIASAAIAGRAGLASAILGALLGFGLLVVPFALGGLGAGDVKLLVAIGAWLGPQATYEVFVASAACAGAYAIGLVFLRGGFTAVLVELAMLRLALVQPGLARQPAGAIAAEVARPDRRRRLVPFAAMVGLGYCAVLIWHRDDLGAIGAIAGGER